ncbi:hypothetical protein [Sansalvadorimonas verongulae]|uniref:hypothetical protein n=1 Tax=Sansalvadorimonas verongulae TaxID=2172824 RepID=UPI0012BB9B60|nr:hypothetical protein [Sansalvadorimonas verongulae]MTI13444.1 hypothetical protein [Sansalvadorimonas verongulae]
MSKLGEYIGDRLPNLKNAWGTLEAKTQHNGLLGKLRFLWRGLKVTVVNALRTFRTNAEDTPVHVMKLDKRDIQLHKEIWSGGKLSAEQLETMAGQGDAKMRAKDFGMILEFMEDPDNIAALKAGYQKAVELGQVEDERRAELAEQNRKAGMQDGLDVLKADQQFAEDEKHATWRQDWQTKLTVFGSKRTGASVNGAAYHFAKALNNLSTEEDGKQKDISLEMRDQAMRDALEANLRELDFYQLSLDKELEMRYKSAKDGKPISPQRLSTLKRYAAHDAIEYTKKCLESKDAREHLMLVYRKEFHGTDSIRPVLSSASTPDAFTARVEQLEQMLSSQQKPSSAEDESQS